MAEVTPWWRDVELREEIVESSGEIADVQMSLGGVAEGGVGAEPPYARADYYGEITHPSGDLTALMGAVAARLAGGERAQGLEALVRLDQGMGGGKSHGLIGLWHLARDPRTMRQTDVGRAALEEADKRARQSLPEDLGTPQTVVLACDNMTAGHPAPETDGPARNLYERFLWRLVGGDRTMFDRYREHYANKAKITEALYAVNRPVLILVDEVLNYIEQLSHSENADLAVEDLAFFRALCDAVDEVPGVVMVVVMIASEDDKVALDEAGERRREDLEGLLTRNGTTATVTSGADFADILRRRLFKRSGTPEVVAATAQKYLQSMRGQWRERVFDHLPRSGEQEFESQVQRTYPFHPLLMDVAEEEWSRIAGFQRVRSTIRIFAAAVHALRQRADAGGWAPLLIGPGDLPLANATVRESVIGSGLIATRRAEANYRSLVEGDIVRSDDRSGAARLIDLESSGREDNPRAAERAATALFLHSIVGGRKQGQQGATPAELQAATFIADDSFVPTDAEMVLASLEDPDTGLASREIRPGRGGRQPRWAMTTRNTLEMHYRQTRSTITDEERDERLARIASESARTGPFREKSFVEAPEGSDPVSTISAAGIDDARTTRLVVLDPRTYVFLNGVDEATRRALDAALGLGEGAPTVRWASSVALAVVNTQRRAHARRAVIETLAWERVCELDEVRADEESLRQARERLSDAKDRATKMVGSAYQHIVYLDEGENGRERREVRLDPTKESALDGTTVWKHLVEQGKALDTGEFDAGALLHNLREGDYGRPLGELRDLFWSAPRMPLLPQGDADLQRAIYQAVNRGDLRLVGTDGRERTVSSSNDIGVGQSGLQLLRPHEQVDDTETGESGEQRTSTKDDFGEDRKPDSSDTGHLLPPDSSLGEDTPASEVQLTLMLNASMREPEIRGHVWEALNTLAEAIDEGKASHTQFQIRVVLDETTARTIAQKINEAGGQANSNKM